MSIVSNKYICKVNDWIKGRKKRQSESVSKYLLCIKHCPWIQRRVGDESLSSGILQASGGVERGCDSEHG